MNARVIAAVALTAALSSCIAIVDPGVSCTREARPGISVTILDSATSAPAGSSSRIVARDGLVADSVPSQWTAASDGPFGLAYERPGSYILTITKTGYRDWTKSGIVVTADQCHVRTVPVTALLQK